MFIYVHVNIFMFLCMYAVHLLLFTLVPQLLFAGGVSTLMAASISVALWRAVPLYKLKLTTEGQNGRTQLLHAYQALLRQSPQAPLPLQNYLFGFYYFLGEGRGCCCTPHRHPEIIDFAYPDHWLLCGAAQFGNWIYGEASVLETKAKTTNSPKINWQLFGGGSDSSVSRPL